MLRTILALITFFGAVSVWAEPELSMHWTSGETRSLQLQVNGSLDIFEQCLNSGFEVRYRYEIKLCDQRVFWFDDCEEPVSITQAAQYDAVSQDYSLSIDRRGDSVAPQIVRMADPQEILSLVSQVREITLEDLGLDAKNEKRMRGADGRVRVKVRAECKGQYSKTLARVSYFLTLGILRLSGFNSGWVSFRITG